jgi:hypothetical protein
LKPAAAAGLLSVGNGFGGTTMTMRAILLAATALGFGVSTALSQAEAPRAAQAERLQVIYDAATRSVSRVTVRVVDPQPGLGLDFVWEPAAGNLPGVDPATGLATGAGKLTWRIKGSPNYDPATVHSTYVGEMLAGVPHGEGRMERRDGSFEEGGFVAGLLEGKGAARDAAGNRYDGDFVRGLYEGQGRLALTDGSIYTGPFKAGRRDGEGTMRLAGGTEYKSTWRDGMELGGKRPNAMADLMVGGLLRAQAGGGDAGKVEMTVDVDPRITLQQEVQYQQLVRDEDIAVYPVSDLINNAWNGDGVISENTDPFEVDTDNIFAFLQVGMKTTDESRVRLDSMELEVAWSDAYRKPMLSLQQHIGCVGFRPDFNFLNHGWGGVKNPKMTVRFTSEEREGEFSPDYQVSLDGFEEGADVSVLSALEEAGVDTNALSNERFRCDSFDQLNICKSQVFNKVGFGAVADFVTGDQILQTTATGELAYEYADDRGNVYPITEKFRVPITLAVIEIDESVAECGDGGAMAAEALRYIDVELPTGKENYAIDLPIRGNKNVKEYVARLKMFSDKSSLHSVTPVIKFADGSTRRTKPVTLFYYKPKPWPDFFSNVALPQCYLDPGFGGSC